MKILILLLVALGQTSALGLPSCQVDSSVKTGTNSVVLTLTPSPLEILDAAGLGNSNSPTAILNKLDGAGNPLSTIVTGINSFLSKLNLPKIPTCRFKFISSQLFCDNMPGSILSSLCGIGGIFSSVITKVTKPISFPLPQLPQVPLTCESPGWGLAMMNASSAWAAGFNGSGIVVANIDSGVRYTHEELKGNFRSTYNWFNPYNPTNTTPYDDNGHGTHTMGTMVGKTVGVAPGATWIACKGCQGSSCDSEPLADCLTYLLCPDNKTLNCATRPRIINNSWGGGIGDTTYDVPLALMAKFGIISFFSSGNSGPLCSTVASPADGDSGKFNFLSVGATACNDNIASYSSNGPSQAAAVMGRLKPDIVAPGSNIFSAWNTDDTANNTISGTSMSSPNAAGAAAVLLSMDSTLTYSDISNALLQGAFHNLGVQSNSIATCNLTLSSNLWPNNVYGYGRIDIQKSMTLLSA